jgi:hypothetical protein
VVTCCALCLCFACKQAAVAPAAAAAPTVAPVVRSAHRSSSDGPTATEATAAAATAAARQLNRRGSSGSSGSNSRDYHQQQRNAPSSSGSDRSSSNGTGSNSREQAVPTVRTPPLQVHGAAAAVTAVARGVVARQGLRSAGEAKDTATADTTAGGADTLYTKVSAIGHTLLDLIWYLCVFVEG